MKMIFPISLRVLILTGLLYEQSVSLLFLKQTKTTVPLLVKPTGYPLEEHKVVTDDGYILTMHRIPYSPKNKTSSRPVVFIMHGFMASSADTIILGPDKGLAYLLSDRGFDVWMGNARGNVYSNNHIEKDPKHGLFWNFSWHEIGIYDLPAMFKHVRNKTSVEKFQYVAHSQGTTSLFVLCSIHPEYNNWLRSTHLMGTLAFTEYIHLPFDKILREILGAPSSLFAHINFNVFPNSEQTAFLGHILCKDGAIFQELCASFLYAIGGESDHLNKSLIPLLSEVFPAGASFKNLIHSFQNGRAEKFRQFDYGPLLNRKRYGSADPPEYKLNNLATPTYIYYGETDKMAPMKNVLRIISSLRPKVLQHAYRVPSKKFNHLDFLFGNDVKTLLYDQLIQDIEGELYA